MPIQLQSSLSGCQYSVPVAVKDHRPATKKLLKLIDDLYRFFGADIEKIPSSSANSIFSGSRRLTTITSIRPHPCRKLSLFLVTLLKTIETCNS